MSIMFTEGTGTYLARDISDDSGVNVLRPIIDAMPALPMWYPSPCSAADGPIMMAFAL